ncbi:hypothetical protein SAMN05518849_11897 [Sphingobium sp. AP50]|nr:hypothetical protein [Sphingobium sp. AP50]SEJ92422.1 hypothetical protein SAMN05518849_11897 [Sphingobium sp. AP50]
MIDEMNMRRFARKTQIDYIRHVERFAYYLGLNRTEIAGGLNS